MSMHCWITYALNWVDYHDGAGWVVAGIGVAYKHKCNHYRQVIKSGWNRAR